MPRARGKLVVLGIIGQCPLAGVAWQAVHYLVGFRRLGWDVYYLEDSGAPPYDPRVDGVTDDCSYAVSFIAQTMRRMGFGDRWAYLRVSPGGPADHWARDETVSETYGLPRSQIVALYREATAIVNLTGSTQPRAEHRQGARLIYVETDPGYEQYRVASGDAQAIRGLDDHDVLFTYGENLGQPDCPVPLGRFAWHKTRPPVVLDLWQAESEAAAPCFTTVARWVNTGKDVADGDEIYHWSKDVNFQRFIDLPRRTSKQFRLAIAPSGEAAPRLRAAGWEIVDPAPLNRSLDAYRDFIAGSRGEFTVAKDLYVRPRSGWFSDRSVCYLAAGKPVVTQDTGFGKFVPTGQGLFAYSTVEEAADALARIDADYPAHSAAARRIAAEFFDAERVLGQLMKEAGLDG